MNESDFTEVALPFAVVILQDVALAFFAAKHLARGSNFLVLAIPAFLDIGAANVGEVGPWATSFSLFLKWERSGFSELPRWLFSKVGIKKCRIAKIKVY